MASSGIFLLGSRSLPYVTVRFIPNTFRANILSSVIIAPFLRPDNGVGDTPPLPYYLYCLIGVAVLMVGVLYWAVWKLVLPHLFKFRLVPRKEVLKDGTVVTLVSRLCRLSLRDRADCNQVLS